MRRTGTALPGTALLAIVLAAGCVTAGELDQRLGAWIGRDADELATAWGAPSGSYVRKDGGKILSYERTVITATGSTEFPEPTSRTCRINITVDPGNKIDSARWQGAVDQCAQLIGEAQGD